MNKKVRWRYNKKRLLVLAVLFILIMIGMYLSTRSLIGSYFYEHALANVSVQGNLQQAEKDTKRALFFSKKDFYYRTLSEINLAKLKVLLSQSDTPEEVTQKQFQTFFTEAQKAAQKATRLHDKNLLNWIQLGKVYTSVVPFNIDGAYEQAIESYTKARILDPQNPTIPLRIAELAIARNNIEKAKEEIDQALVLKKDFTDALLLRAQIQIKEGNTQGAILTTEKILTYITDSPSIYFQLGIFKFNVKDYAGAAEALTRAIELTPDYSNARYFLGLSYYNLGQKQQALQEFEKIREADPDNEEIIHILANLKAGKSPLVQAR